jgi:hypothetical protein
MNGLTALAVMAKMPAPGLVKTRLAPPLTHAEAAALSARFLRDTLDTAQKVAAAANAQGFLAYAPAEADPAPFLPDNFIAWPQKGAGLGERLTRLAVEIFKAGYHSLCIIGADTPHLPPEYLQTALELLRDAGERLVLGPAEDGGYYLIGLQKPRPRLFQNIDWSSQAVLEQTLARAGELNLPVELLPLWYDIDDAAALGRLCRDSPNIKAAPRSRRYLDFLRTPKPPT